MWTFLFSFPGACSNYLKLSISFVKSCTAHEKICNRAYFHVKLSVLIYAYSLNIPSDFVLKKEVNVIMVSTLLTALTSCCANCTHLTDLTLEIYTDEALYYNINRLKIKGLSEVPTQMLISKRLLILNIDCEKMYPEGLKKL